MKGDEGNVSSKITDIMSSLEYLTVNLPADLNSLDLMSAGRLVNEEEENMVLLMENFLKNGKLGILEGKSKIVILV